jgi:hypothetical protein
MFGESQNVRQIGLDRAVRPGQLGARSVRRPRTVPAGSDKEVVPVRTIVIVLIGLVVVLAVLTELCLLQAAAMRRRIKAALPPEEGEDR